MWNVMFKNCAFVYIHSMTYIRFTYFIHIIIVCLVKNIKNILNALFS